MASEIFLWHLEKLARLETPTVEHMGIMRGAAVAHALSLWNATRKALAPPIRPEEAEAGYWKCRECGLVNTRYLTSCDECAFPQANPAVG